MMPSPQVTLQSVVFSISLTFSAPTMTMPSSLVLLNTALFRLLFGESMRTVCFSAPLNTIWCLPIGRKLLSFTVKSPPTVIVPAFSV